MTICKTCGKDAPLFSWESECFNCRQKRNRQEIQEQITNGDIDRTGGESDIFCPYCGEIYEIDDEYELYEDGEHELDCPNCEKRFTVDVYVSYSYSTERSGDDEQGD